MEGRFEDRAAAIRIFEEHNREVIATIPSQRLLVFDVKEGWQPLCAFLGVPVPADEPFPHVNDAADFSRRQRDQYRHIARMLLPALGAAVAGAAGADPRPQPPARAAVSARLRSPRDRRCFPSSSKFAGSSQVSKLARSAGHSWSRIENQAVSRFMPLKMRCW